MHVNTANELFAPPKSLFSVLLLLCCILLLSNLRIFSSSGTGKINQTAINTLQKIRTELGVCV